MNGPFQYQNGILFMWTVVECLVLGKLLNRVSTVLGIWREKSGELDFSFLNLEHFRTRVATEALCHKVYDRYSPSDMWCLHDVAIFLE